MKAARKDAARNRCREAVLAQEPSVLRSAATETSTVRRDVPVFGSRSFGSSDQTEKIRFRGGTGEKRRFFNANAPNATTHRALLFAPTRLPRFVLRASGPPQL